MFVFNLFENTEQKHKSNLPVVKEDAWHNGQNSWSSEHDQWAKESVEEDRLSVGDPVVVTAPNEYEGKTGEISEFSPSGKFVIVNLYNYGEHSMHLSDVEYNKYANNEVDEGVDSSPVAGAITRRILMQRLDLLKQYGPELVGAAVDNVADYVGDVDEIGSSDVSAWVTQVERMLKDNPPEAFSEGQVSDEVTHRGDVDTKANIEVTGVDFDNDTFDITYNGKPYQVKTQLFSQEDLGRWQIADYDVDIINSKGKKVIINYDSDRQVTMVNTIIAYLDTQQASDIQYMAWRQVGIENSTAEELYQEIQDFYQNDQQKIDKATAWLAQNMEDTDQRQVFADYVKNPGPGPARTKYIPKEYLIYVAFSYSREGNTELTPGMNLKPIQLDDPDDEEEFYRKVDELFRKVQFKFDAFENKIIELAHSHGLGSDPDLGSGFGQREMIWDYKQMTTSSSESNKNRQQILAQAILNFRANVEKYVAAFNNTLIKIGLPGIGEYSTWSGVLGDQLTDQQVRYFNTPEGFANLAAGKIDLAKMLDDNVDKQGVAEGWSDAMLSRRTGGPRTSYSVYIKGKKWKDFENDDHAEAVANKLRAKFRAEGRDPSVITIAPTDMSEAISKKDLVGQLQKDLPKVTDPKNKNARPVAWTGPGKDDYGYTGYQGHGMPTDRQERDRIRADKKKGVAEGLIYSGDTWQDVLYRINMLNDIFGDQRDLADTFEPASQPEWIPFRDRILRSRTVLDTYAKVKQLANMNVPLTDVEIEMLDDVAWDGGGGPVEPAGHWGERDYDWLEDLYAQQFAVVQHLLDQKAQGRGQNKTKSGQTVHEQGVAEAEKKGLYYNVNKRKAAGTSRPANDPKAPTAQAWKDAAKTAKKESVAEAPTDYSKRRARERDVDAGKPVKALPKNPQTDYARKRAKERRDQELGETINYWTKLQNERNTKIASLVSELTESIEKK